MNRICAATGLLLATAMGSVSYVAAANALEPDPATVYLQSLAYEGSACPRGTVGQSTNAERTSFTLIFDSFVASAGPGVPASANSKAGDLALTLKAPNGWSWAIAGVDLRGYVQLATSALGRVGVEFQYPHTVNPAFYPPLSSTFAGPVAKDYLTHVETPPMRLQWSRCGGVNTLRLRASVQIEGATDQPGQVTVDSIDGRIITGDATLGQGFHLIWQRCIP